MQSERTEDCNPVYKMTVQVIPVKWIRIQNDINKYNTQKLRSNITIQNQDP